MSSSWSWPRTTASPPTIEAIDHARAAEVPIVVAINKCDKPRPSPIGSARTGRYDLVDEHGKTIVRNIPQRRRSSTRSRRCWFWKKCHPRPTPGSARGVVESELSKGQGPVAWVLVQTGTLHVGDVFLAGETYGRVRAMINSRGDHIEEAPPATPVLVLGFNEVATAGDQFVVVDDERVARAIAAKRVDRAKLKQGATAPRITLEIPRTPEGRRASRPECIIKADVARLTCSEQSAEARQRKRQVELVHSGVGDQRVRCHPGQRERRRHHRFPRDRQSAGTETRGTGRRRHPNLPHHL